MSRFKRLAHSVASGYVLLAVTAVYALGSLPLALHYLSTDRFGLWSLMASVTGYLSLIDLGMSGAVARLLIDHKDDREGTTYGSLIKTGWMVLSVQGLMILTVGFFFAPALCYLLKIHTGLQTDFIHLVRWQSAVLAVSFCVRIFNHLLTAHQRIDITNYNSMVGLGLNFVFLWFFFHRGCDVFSLVWASLCSSIISAFVALGACFFFKLFPAHNKWGRTSWGLFKELFAYGKDMFLVAVGTQLIMASQTMIITRELGLAASGAWYAATRTFNLISQAIWRISDFSAPAFSEMMVRGEKSLLQDRYKAVVGLSASAAGFAAVSFAICNSLFVHVYTAAARHLIEWPVFNDVLLGLWMIVMATQHCHSGFVLITKRIGFMRYIYFIEGVVFVSAALLSARWGGLPAIIGCSAVCTAWFSGSYCSWRISKYFDLPVREVALRWLAPMSRVLLLFAPAAAAVWWLGHTGEATPLIRLTINTLFSGSVGVYLFLRFGLSRPVQVELLQRAPRTFNPVLKLIFVGASQ